VEGAPHPFTDVDAQPDPAAWIGVLDRLRADPAYAAYKRRVAALLEPEPGERYLEVGAGPGADALALEAERGVEVVGVDASRVMVEEARRRGLAGATRADAHSLPFPDATFAGAWADRMLQHLADPARAVSEMARVVRRGGRVVAADPDYGTQVVNVPDQALARRVLALRAGVWQWTLAHQLPRVFVQAGLGAVRVEAVPIVVTDPAALDHALGLRGWARLGAGQGMVEESDVAAWESQLDDAARNGWFLYAFCVFITAGRRLG
jgi:SAM-dependent methyltransferase